jgi:HSP20 family protein
MDTHEKGKSQQEGQRGQEVARGSQQQRGLSRPGNYEGFGISPAEFFRLGPLALMRRMNEEMSRMFGDFGDGGSWSRGWSPAIEVKQRDNKMTICAELPGMKPDDVHIEMTDDSVVIEGERRDDREENERGVRVTERRYGHFYREIPLPEGANSENVKAHFDNGVLEIEVPVQERQSSRRQIPIQPGGSREVQGKQSPGSETPGKQPSSNRAA